MTTTKSQMLASSARFVRADAEESEEDKKKREDAARRDADGGTLPKDEIMDAMTRMADACERMADRMDRQDARMDAVEGMIKDKRKDWDEDKDKDDKKKDASGAENEEEEKAESEEKREDKRKDGEDEKEEEKKDGEDEKAKEERDDKRKDREEHADSVDMAKLRAEVADLGKKLSEAQRLIPRQVTDADGALLTGRQAMADAVYIEGGHRAPAPLINEDLGSYRRRLAVDIQQKFGVMKDVNLWGVADAAGFERLERELYQDAVAEARRPSNIGPDQVRGVKREEGGHTFVEYHGDSAAWMVPMSIPATRGFGTVTEIMRVGHAR